MVVCDPFRQGFRHFLNNIHFDKYQFLSNEYWFLGLAKSDPWVHTTHKYRLGGITSKL